MIHSIASQNKVADGGPAFPQTNDSSTNPTISQGMSLRAWLAGQVLQGLYANEGCMRETAKASGSDTSNFAAINVQLALEAADRMIARLNNL
jgi:hypothetical protein